MPGHLRSSRHSSSDTRRHTCGSSTAASASVHSQASRAISASSASTSTMAGLNALEKRQQFGADPIARNGQVVVGVVVDIGDTLGGEIRQKVSAPAVEQRADERAAARMHRGKAAHPGAPHETQEERLGLVVSRVAERHDVGVEVRARALEEGVPSGSRRHPQSNGARRLARSATSSRSTRIGRSSVFARSQQKRSSRPAVSRS